jgi:hypothetical protein
MSRVPQWSELVRCPWCGAQPDERCRDPQGEAARTHRARIVLSVVGEQSAQAVDVVEAVLAKTAAQQTPKKPASPEK